MLGQLAEALMLLTFLSGASIIGLYQLAYAARCVLVVVHGTSAGAERVHWPDEAIMDWVSQSVGLVGLVLIWLIPAGILAQNLSSTFLTDSRALRTLVLAVPILWLLFPIGALSSLSAVSRWVFFRPVIALQLLRVFPALLFFYLSTAVVGALGFGPLYLATFGRRPVLLLLAAPLSAAMVLVYARLLGRLGWIIRQLDPLPETRPAKAQPKVSRSLRKQIKVNDPWTTPVEEPAALPARKPKPPLGTILSEEEENAEPYGLADHKSTANQEESKPKRQRPLDDEELDAMQGYGLAEPAAAPGAETKTEEAVEDRPAAPSPGDEVPRKRGPSARRKAQPKLAWPLLRGVYGFPWRSESLSAWTWLTMGFVLLGLLTAGCLHFLPGGPD